MIWLLPPAGLARTATPGIPGARAQRDGDLFVRARAFVARHEDHADLAAMGAAPRAPPAAVPVAAAAARW